METKTIVQAQATTLEPIARLAAAVAHCSRSSWTGIDTDRFTTEEIQRFSREMVFATPLRRFLSSRAHDERPWSTASEIERIVGTRDGKFAILILSEPEERHEEAALLLAAAVLHRPILRANDKTERSRLRAAFGAAAWKVATQEAPALYANLSTLANENFFRNTLSRADDEVQARKSLLAFGRSLTTATVASVAAFLGPLMAQRFPPAAPEQPTITVDCASRAQIIKLIQRRMPSWSAFIS